MSTNRLVTLAFVLVTASRALSPEAHYGREGKALSSGKMSLNHAQAAIARDWSVAYFETSAERDSEGPCCVCDCKVADYRRCHKFCKRRPMDEAEQHQCVRKCHETKSVSNEGCPHGGADHRRLGEAVCWLQRKLTFDSTVEPLSVVLAFPPYVVMNIPLGRGSMLMVRAGWRFDRNAESYIFPTAAIKRVDTALLY